MISILSLLAVVLGIASGFIKNRCVVISFGILFLPVWIVFTISTLTVMALTSGASETPEGLVAFCDDTPEKNNAFTEAMEEYAGALETLYDGSDKWMCSS